VETRVDAVVVGAGFGGLYALHRLRESGLSVRVFEAGSDVGGTWYWNRYPGARCDVESFDYSYSFSEELQQEWDWTERYASQPEILSYIEHVADRFDLRRDITFDTRVDAATFDEAEGRWLIETSPAAGNSSATGNSSVTGNSSGEQVSATYLVMATGCLSSSRIPDFPGIDEFEGQTFHTGRWPSEPVDLEGKRVGVIGTGSSGVQVISALAPRVGELKVFQRTPTYILPDWNRPISPDELHELKATYPQRRREAAKGALGIPIPVTPFNKQSAMAVSERERIAEYERRWKIGGVGVGFSFKDLLFDKDANDTIAEFIRDKIRERVEDPEVAEKLLPRSYAYGTKRPSLGVHYYDAYNRDNVHLVDVSDDPIVELTRHGLRTETTEHELDAIVFATGFDAMTGTLNAIDIRGRGGRSLREHWSAGPRTYLGIGVAGFPNMFIITGPGSPSVLTNMIFSIEQHVRWIADLIDHMRAEGTGTVEATEEAEDRWTRRVAELADRSLYPATDSWFLGANVPGKPRTFMVYLGGAPSYAKECQEIADAGYAGFEFSRTAARAATSG
jgi:cyclohexanone monooxygenase